MSITAAERFHITLAAILEYQMKWRPCWGTELILASHVNTPTYLK